MCAGIFDQLSEAVHFGEGVKNDRRSCLHDSVGNVRTSMLGCLSRFGVVGTVIGAEHWERDLRGGRSRFGM